MQRLHGTSTTYRRTRQLYCLTSHSFMKLNTDHPVITSVYWGVDGLVCSIKD